jgi:hypothetical protein
MSSERRESVSVFSLSYLYLVSVFSLSSLCHVSVLKNEKRRHACARTTLSLGACAPERVPPVP